jgi:tripartite-type tricarboxylate transporter receptor subunit TctC
MVRALGFATLGPQDMDLLCLVTKTKPVLAVRTQSPWRSWQDFVQSARARPEYFVIGNSGTGSIWHINALLMEQAAGLRLVHCPFSGSSAALAALLGGHVDAAVAGAGEVAPHVKAGALRALAVFDEKRSPLFTDVPAVREHGYEFGVSAWSGFFGPKGLPPPVKARLASAFRAAFGHPEFQTLCRERGMEPVFLGPDEFARFAMEQARFFESVIPRLVAGGGS